MGIINHTEGEIFYCKKEAPTLAFNGTCGEMTHYMAFTSQSPFRNAVDTGFSLQFYMSLFFSFLYITHM